MSSADRKKTVLILSASAGAGHVHAAQALVETAEQLALPFSIQHEDILDFTFPLFKKIYSKIQFKITDVSPELWGYFFRKTEFKGFPKHHSELTKLFNHFNYKAYFDLLKRTKPDALVCTHFLPYLAIYEETQKRSWQTPIFSVTTDYDLHSLWVDSTVERFYVATKQAAWTLRSHGISEKQILTTGIPISPKFASAGNRRMVSEELEIDHDAFTILILSGGYGIGIIDELILALGEFLSSYKRRRFQLLVSAARNETLYKKLQKIKLPQNTAMHIYKLVPYVGKLMDASDVLITKAGGLTVTEALAKHLPMIIFDPTPGQENRNAVYLMEEGAALSASSIANLTFKLHRLIENAEMLHAMKEHAQRIAQPDAAKRIWEDIGRRLR